MTNYSRTTLRELKKRYSNVLKKCFLINIGVLLFATSSFAESSYVMKEVGTGGILVPEYDANTNSLVNKQYEIDLKNKSYGNDDVSRTYQVEIFGKEIDIIANYDPEKSNPRYHSPSGDISGTWVDIETKDHLGGAYNNWYGGTTTLTGDFVNNIIDNGASTARGGAYGNVYDWAISSIKGNYIANGALSEGTAQGGAIYSQENLAAPNAIFIGNWAKGGTKANGGALVNFGGYSDPVHSHFIGNYAESVSGEAGGGAVFLYGHNINIEGDFIGNYARSETGTAMGGGVYLKYRSGCWSENFSLKGDFIDNKVISMEGAGGGAIYNGKDISLDFINGTFLYNSANAKEALGGAIYNASIIKEVEGKFVGNQVLGVENAKGGAIYNADTGNLLVQDSQFFYNEVLSEEGEAKGGAIYNAGKMTFKGNNIFAENKVNNALNDIHNEGEMTIEGTTVVNSGITGSGTLTIAKDGVLDIQNSEIETGVLKIDEGGTLKVALTSLTEHGTVKGNVEGGEKSRLDFGLKISAQEGDYKIFEKDNDIALKENTFFNIQDLKNGAFKVSKKTAEDLKKDFDMTDTQSLATRALIESESEHQVFSQVQEEMLEALQSEDKGKVQKAKKALSAVGAKEHPVEQSVASEHLVALQNVVQSEMHGVGVGRAGGDTDPRAKVYIKGLYDRTKSSQGEGFRARSKGAVLGVQSEVTEDLTLGVGYATSQTTAKEDLRRTEVDTNTGFISAHYQPNAWWVSGLATFSRGEYEEEKQILSSMGKASYDVDSWGAQVMTGYDIKLDNAIITPEVGLRYLAVKQEGYTDTLGTTVSGTQSDYLTALVGMKCTWNMGAIRPTAGVTVGYDIISDDVSALNTLANGASYTVNGEALDRLSTTVTTGIEANLGERTTLKLEYSGTYRKEYTDHSGMLKLEMKF